MARRNSVLFAAALAGLVAPSVGLVHDGPRRVAVPSIASPSALQRSGVPSMQSPVAMALKPAQVPRGLHAVAFQSVPPIIPVSAAGHAPITRLPSLIAAVCVLELSPTVKGRRVKREKDKTKPTINPTP